MLRLNDCSAIPQLHNNVAPGRTLNLQVVGEGIESEEVFDYLCEQGCDQAQGYYFSKPLPADAFENW